MDGTGKAESKRHHAYRCVNGHFMRNGDIIDTFVTEICIDRLSRLDASDLLAPLNEGLDIGLLNARRVALDSREATISRFILSGQMNEKNAAVALSEVAEERRAITGEIARAVHSDPLAEVIDSGNARAWCADASLARRRDVLKLIMTCVIKTVGKGKRILEGKGEERFSAVEPTVDFEWQNRSSAT